MSKGRRLELPKLPSSAEEFSELVIQSPFSRTHRLTIREGNETAVLFASDQMIAKIKETETVHFDATFKSWPTYILSITNGIYSIYRPCNPSTAYINEREK